MDLRKVKKLIELAEEADLSELEVSGGDESVRIVRQKALAGAPLFGESNAHASGVVISDATLRGSVFTIDSPMAGTFYRSSSPESSPFVLEGQKINTGDVVCIIESMKMMHEIKALQDGQVSKIFVDDGQAVGTGDPLIELI